MPPGSFAHVRENAEAIPEPPEQLRRWKNRYSGGRQFESKNDPDWKVLAEWVNGKKAPVK